MASREDILDKIFIDEDAVFEKVVDKAGKVFKIDRQGNILFEVSAAKLTDRQRVALVLLTRFLLFQKKRAESDVITNGEIAEALGIDTTIVTARLADLRRERVAVPEGRGRWRVSLIGVDRILDEILER